MGGEIVSIGVLCFSMVLIGLSLGFLLLKVQGE
uniref:Cytochrome b6-f complex subunit 7 n=1 Tax=Arthrothamnus bifidus TaxID=169778 RepID=A0A8F0FCJ5_9PHAE|nr:cytochrome b6-f complex subunit VII [Arthrothamnus bifidus]